MSVVAFDGRSLAADRQVICNDMRMIASKIRKMANGPVMAWVGSQDAGLMLMQWYEAGHDPKEWPECQRSEHFGRLIVARKSSIEFYEQCPVAIPVVDSFMAWGAGQDFAMGAMAMGATAKEAVEVANGLSVMCGCGVEVYEL